MPGLGTWVTSDVGVCVCMLACVSLSAWHVSDDGGGSTARVRSCQRANSCERETSCVRADGDDCRDLKEFLVNSRVGGHGDEFVCPIESGGSRLQESCVLSGAMPSAAATAVPCIVRDNCEKSSRITCSNSV